MGWEKARRNRNLLIMNNKKIALFCGFLLIGIGLVSGGFLISGILQSIFADECRSRDVICVEAVAPPLVMFTRFHAPRVLSVDESRSVTVYLKGWYKESLNVSVNLTAPDFDVAPDRPYLLTVDGDNSSFVKWVISPKEPGLFTVVASAEITSKAGEVVTVDTTEQAIKVNHFFGLSSQAVFVINLISGALGSMLTISWWLEWWSKRKKVGNDE